MTSRNDAATLAGQTLRLLERTEPIAEEHDVVWPGPWFIPRSGQWYATRFALYDGRLFGHLLLDSTTCSMSWRFGAETIELERQWMPDPRYHNDEELWVRVLGQVVRKLRRAVENPGRYNAHVARHLPFACRTGRIRRRLTWEDPEVPPVPELFLDDLEQRLSRRPAAWDHLTTARYLEVTEIAYDSFFGDARSMTVFEKHQRWADSRHGGMLDLDPNDAEAFRAWFLGRSWAGTHPFEIVFGHPHGIHLWPRHHESAGPWTFLLAAGAEGYFAMGVTMARALLEEGIPVELADAKQVLTSLRGEDEVEVGPHLYMLSLAELEEYRPSAVAHIHWDPIPEILPISVEQARRVAHACGKDT